MTLYADHGSSIHSWEEICNLKTRVCTWEQLIAGKDYVKFREEPRNYYSYLFESDSGFADTFLLSYKLQVDEVYNEQAKIETGFWNVESGDWDCNI